MTEHCTTLNQQNNDADDDRSAEHCPDINKHSTSQHSSAQQHNKNDTSGEYGSSGSGLHSNSDSIDKHSTGSREHDNSYSTTGRHRNHDENVGILYSAGLLKAMPGNSKCFDCAVEVNLVILDD